MTFSPSLAMAHLVDVRQISKSFGSTQAHRRASISLDSEEIHALVGENGAGKSTLMKFLAGVHQKEEGLVMFDGVEVDPRTPQAARSLGISSVFQELSLCNNLAVAEKIFANREMAGLHPVASSKRVAGAVYRETALNGSSTNYKKEI